MQSLIPPRAWDSSEECETTRSSTVVNRHFPVRLADSCAVIHTQMSSFDKRAAPKLQEGERRLLAPIPMFWLSNQQASQTGIARLRMVALVVVIFLPAPAMGSRSTSSEYMDHDALAHAHDARS
ncbi:unnamed protein product [Diplocarpon coronariae]|nr:hypothetical protein JHW43_006693 [Diplocarpon mali]